MNGFEQFWSIWPKNFRKGGKSLCLARWKKGYYETHTDQIVKHVAWQKTTEAWLKDAGAFVPAPLVYLNQQRWDGAEIPEMFADKVRLDPALQKINSDYAKAAPMPDAIRKKLQELRKMS